MVRDDRVYRFSRRRALSLLTGTVGVSLMAACAPIQSAPTKPTAAPAAAPPATAPAKPSEGAPKAAEPKPTAQPKPAAPPTATGAMPKAGGTLMVATQTDILNFDAHALPGANRPIFRQIYNSLVTYDESLRPQPELAESWEFAPDNLSMTLKLQKGVKFHSGRDFTSEDVLWNLERLQDPKVAANTRVFAIAVKDAEAVDAHTVKFGFERPTPAIFDLLDVFYVMDREVPDVKTSGAGTGPFKLGAWSPGDQLRLVKHETYWRKDLPRLNEIQFKAMPDASGRIVNLESGAVDVVFQPLTNDYVRLKEGGRFQTPAGADGNTVLDFIMNVSQKPFDDRRVRQAFNLAVDRQRVLERVYSGVGETTCIPFAQSSIGYDAGLAKGCEFNLDRAKQLLAEAGYPDGLDVTVMADSSSPTMRQFGELYQADLAKIGVRVKLNILEPAQYRPAMFGHNFQATVHNFGRANKDPDGMFRIAVAWYPTKEGFSTFTSPELERLVADAGATMDLAKRKELYQQIAKLTVDESYVLSIVSPPQIWALAPHVREFAWNLDGHEILERTWLDK